MDCPICLLPLQIEAKQLSLLVKCTRCTCITHNNCLEKWRKESSTCIQCKEYLPVTKEFECDVHNLNKDVFEEDYDLLYVSHFFDDVVCDTLITISEDVGYEDINVNKDSVRFGDENLRSDQAVSITAPFLLFMLLTKLKSVFADKEIVDLNPNIRFSKYKRNTKCSPHVDPTSKELGLVAKCGAFGVDGTFVDEYENVSKWTALIYLNDSTGTTRFFNIETMKYVDVIPKKGSLVLFDQRIPHAAFSPDDVKYTMRTDVLIEKPKQQQPIFTVNRIGIINDGGTRNSYRLRGTMITD